MSPALFFKFLNQNKYDSNPFISGGVTSLSGGSAHQLRCGAQEASILRLTSLPPLILKLDSLTRG
jgi:hypothetical protein